MMADQGPQLPATVTGMGGYLGTYIPCYRDSLID